MPDRMKSKLPEMPGETGFGLGFFCGAFLGAVGVYLVTTPEGKELRKVIEKEFVKHQQTSVLEAIIPLEGNNPQPPIPILSTIRTYIQKARAMINPSIPKESEKIAAKNIIRQSKKKRYFKQK